MKTRILLAIAVFVLFTAFKPSPSPQGKRVLVVGFIEDHFTTNFFTIDQIAEANQVEGALVLEFLNESLCKSLEENENKNDVNFVVCPNTEEALDFRSNISISEGNCEKKRKCFKSDITTLRNNGGFQNFLNECDVNYLMVINGYKMDYVGDPYYMIRHEISFDIYQADGVHVFNSAIEFQTAKLEEWSKMAKKIQREGKRIAKELVSVSI